MREILVLRSGAIGDVLVAFPVLGALKRAFRSARLTFAARTEARELARAAGLADRLVDIGSVLFAPLFGAGPFLQKEQAPSLASFLRSFDLVVSLLRDPDRSMERKLRSLSGAEVLSLRNPPEKGHIAEVLLQVLEPLGIEFPSLSEPFLAPLRSRPFSHESLPITQKRYAVFHTGSGSPQKNWPVENFVRFGRLAASAGFHVVLPKGEADSDVVREAERGLGQTCTVVELPLLELAKLITGSAFYVGNDSGISHTAGLCGAHTVCVFGPTDPGRWRPLGPRVYAVAGPEGGFPSVEKVLQAGRLECFFRKSGA